MSPALPIAVSFPTSLKIALELKVPSSITETLFDASIVILPALPMPKVLVEIKAPRSTNRLLVLISIFPPSPSPLST